MHVSIRQIESIIRISKGKLDYYFSTCKNAFKKLSREERYRCWNISIAGFIYTNTKI